MTTILNLNDNTFTEIWSEAYIVNDTVKNINRMVSVNIGSIKTYRRQSIVENFIKGKLSNDKKCKPFDKYILIQKISN